MKVEDILVILDELIGELQMPTATKNPQVVIDRWAQQLIKVKDAVNALEIVPEKVSQRVTKSKSAH